MTLVMFQTIMTETSKAGSLRAVPEGVAPSALNVKLPWHVSLTARRAAAGTAALQV
jgi:hypothetical protein